MFGKINNMRRAIILTILSIFIIIFLVQNVNAGSVSVGYTENIRAPDQSNIFRGPNSTVYINTYNATYNIVTYSLNDGGTWSRAGAAQLNGGYPAVMVVDSTGLFTAMNRKSNVGSVERYWNGSIGGASSVVSNVSDATYTYQNSATIDGNNTIWLAITNTSGLQIWYKQTNGAWTYDATLLVTSRNDLTNVAITADKNNTIHIAYAEGSDGTGHIRYRSRNATAWSAEETVGHPAVGTTTGDSISIAVNKTGAVLVAWRGTQYIWSGNYTASNIIASVKTTAWGSMFYVSNSNMTQDTHTSISTDLTGAFYISGSGIWNTYADGIGHAYYRIRFPNGTLSTPILMNTGATVTTYPTLIYNWHPGSSGIPATGVAGRYTTNGGTLYYYTSDNLNFPTPPVASFSIDVTTGDRPLTVQFTDTTTASPTSWDWTFGDGQTSTEQNPSHTYTNNGVYTVSLTAYNEQGQSTETQTDCITVTRLPPVITDFTGTPTSGISPLKVQFSCTAIGVGISSYYWTFGDGKAGYGASQLHTYDNQGNYTVSLTVTNEGGSDTLTKVTYINVSEKYTILKKIKAGTATYAPIGDDNYNELVNNTIGDDQDWQSFDLEGIMSAVMSPGVGAFGPYFWIIIFGVVGLLIYIKTDSVLIPGALYLIGGGLLGPMLLPGFAGIIYGIVIVGFAAIGYVLFRSR